MIEDIEDMGGVDPKMMQEIMDQFEKIKKEAGIEPDDQSKKEIEDMLGFSMDEFEADINKKIKTRNLQVKKINPEAYNPVYNYESDSGFDLYSVEEIVLEPFGRALVPTGLAFGIPEEHEIQVRPKSGLALKQGLTVLNTPGTVDAGYDGEIKVIMFNTTNKQVIINKGMKIGQAVLCPVVCGKYVEFELVENIEKRERGDNGFGSTGLF
jgi:dUTP pyrophosphatase